MNRKISHNFITLLLVMIAILSLLLWWHDYRTQRGRQKEFSRCTQAGGWELNTSTGAMVWDDTMFSIFHRDKATFVPTYENFIELLHPDDRARIDARSKAAIAAKGKFSATYRILSPDGTRYIRASGGMSGNGVTAYGICLLIEDGALADDKLIFGHTTAP